MQEAFHRLFPLISSLQHPFVAGTRDHPRATSSPTVLAARGSPINVESEEEVLYSGDSDSPSESKSPPKLGHKAVGAETTTAAPRDSLDKTMRHEMFGSSDESEDPSRGSNRSRSHSYDVSAKQEDISRHDDINDSSRSHRSRSNPSDCGDRSASTYVGTTQEEQDRDALQSAPENKPWMPSLSNLRQWYGYTAGSCRIPLFDSSRLHFLDVSAIGFCTEHDYYIEIFFRNRWFHGNRNRDEFRWCRRETHLSATSKM